MNAITLTDLSAAARALMAVPRAQQAGLMRAMLRDLAADTGQGTLVSIALTYPRRDPCAPGCRDYLEALATALREILAAPETGAQGDLHREDWKAGQNTLCSQALRQEILPCLRSIPD